MAKPTIFGYESHMLYEDCYEFFEMLRSKKRGKRTVCNFEVTGVHAPEVIEYGRENFKGDWTYRKIDGGYTYCIYVNTENDRLLLLLGFSEYRHFPCGINDGKKWIRP